MALEKLAPETRNLIDGEIVEASNGGRFENINPSTEEVLGTASDGTKDDMEQAISAARKRTVVYPLASEAAFFVCRLLKRMAPRVGAKVHRALSAQGVDVRLSTQVQRVHAAGLTTREGGATVEIEGVAGSWTVLDKMARRWTRRIDLYMGINRGAALRWGRRPVTIRWKPPKH